MKRTSRRKLERRRRIAKKILSVATLGVILGATVFAVKAGYRVAVTDSATVADAAGRSVTIDSALIEGTDVVVKISSSTIPASDNGILYLYGDEVYEEGTEGKIVASTESGTQATFSFPLNLNSADSNLSRKFVVAVKRGGVMTQISNEHYITNPEAVAGYTSARMDHGKKGLLLDQNKILTDELSDLGVKQVVYNLNLGYLCGETTDPAHPTIYYEYDGNIYPFNGKVVFDYDNSIKHLNEQGIQVTFVILNNGSEANQDLIHPLALDGHTWSELAWPGYAFNTANEVGVKHIEAIASFIGARYSGTLNCGQVDNWIVGNEVNARTECYYLGSSSLETNVNNYVKAFRLFYNGIKSQNANANIYNSLDQEWQRKSNQGSFLTKDYLDQFNYWMNREGNIDWGLSIHPYNAPLFDPYSWCQQSQYVTNDVHTPYLTIENLHVITDYMQQSDYLAPNGQVRHISLAEIGYSSEFGEDIQAASIIYSYLQAEANPYIDSYQLFRETDDLQEMNNHLALGLTTTDGSHKVAYDFYKNIDGEGAADVKAQVSAIIGRDIDTMIAEGTFMTRKGWFLD